MPSFSTTKFLFNPVVNTSTESSGHWNRSMHASYCGSYEAFYPIWNEAGVSRCFFDTLAGAASLIFWIMLVYRIIKTKRNGVVIHSQYKSFSIGYTIQVVCLVLLVVEVPINFGVQWGVAYHEASGVAIMFAISRIFLLLSSLYLLHLEREMAMVNVMRHGHSTISLLTWCFLMIMEFLMIVSWNGKQWWFQEESIGDKILYGLWVARIIATIFLLCIGIRAPGVPKLNYCLQLHEESNEAGKRFAQVQINITINDPKPLWSILRGTVERLVPYLWPKKKLQLQFRVLVCFAFVIAGRIVNPCIPFFYKRAVDAFIGKSGWYVVWTYILALVCFKCMQDVGYSKGLFNGLRSIAWIRIQQYSTRLIQVGLFRHLHALSLRWYLSENPEEALRSIDRGVRNTNTLLNFLFFSIIPTVFDIIIAVVYFCTVYHRWLGLTVFLSLFFYIGATIYLNEWQNCYNRAMDGKDEAMQVANFSLRNYETVKYYNAEEYEVTRFERAVSEYQVSEHHAVLATQFRTFVQNTVMNFGLLLGSLQCADYIMQGKFSVGDFVFFVTYFWQLHAPLSFFGTQCRMIPVAFSNINNMFELLNEENDVKEVDDAITLGFIRGEVKFVNVCFHYQRNKPVINNISFLIHPGQTVAVVGPPGSGKSTIVRLLMRAYDCQTGMVKVDNHDVCCVTKRSLRSRISVISQHILIFNDTILYNLTYGQDYNRLLVQKTAEKVGLAQRIENLKDQFETVIGDGGAELDAEDRIRVAIARAFLQEAAIVVLDEATKNLDPVAERSIDPLLAGLCRGRTTILLTRQPAAAVDSDKILVLKDGEIVEEGKHEVLLAQGGTYAEMWRKSTTEYERLIHSTLGMR